MSQPTTASKVMFVDDRREMYRPLMPKKWTQAALSKSSPFPIIDEIVVDLLATWRSVSVTSAMPAEIVNMVTASADAYTNSVAAESTLVNFAQEAIRSLNRAVPEMVSDPKLSNKLRMKLVDDLLKLRAVEKTKIEFSPDQLWDRLLDNPQFKMMLWSSQRIAFLAYWNAYEDCLVRFTKIASGTTRLRTSSSDFKKLFREHFGENGLQECWTSTKINIFRLVRHSLAHAGGRETADLKKQIHGLRISDGELQIDTVDNHALVDTLQDSVDFLIDTAITLASFKTA